MTCPCGCEDVRDPTTGAYELCPMAEGWYESLEEAHPGSLCSCPECNDIDAFDPTPGLS